MSEVLQTNIFFIIASFGVVVVTILVAIALWYIIRILRAVKDIAERVREGSEIIAEDAAHLREELLSGNIFSSLYARAAHMAGFGTKAKRRTAKRKASEDDEDIIDTNEAT